MKYLRVVAVDGRVPSAEELVRLYESQGSLRLQVASETSSVRTVIVDRISEVLCHKGDLPTVIPGAGRQNNLDIRKLCGRGYEADRPRRKTEVTLWLLRFPLTLKGGQDVAGLIYFHDPALADLLNK